MITFLEDLSGHPAIGGPRSWAEKRWSAFDCLVEAGVVQITAAQEFDLWPCEQSVSDDCVREIVVEDGVWKAACQCDSPFAPESEPVVPERVRVLPAPWLRFVAAACGLDSTPSTDELAILGARRSGRHDLLFLWCADLDSLAPATLELFAEDRRPDAVVVLVPHRRVLQRLVPSKLRGSRIVWLPLDEVFDPVAKRVDLSTLRMRFGLGDLTLLWPRFQLALAGTSALWWGRGVDFARTPQHVALLRELGRTPGEFVTRNQLLPALFPDEFTNRGRLRTDPGKLDRRLRQLVSRTTADLGPTPDGTPAIENLRARSDIEGGYRLTLHPNHFIDLDGDPHA